MRCRLSKPSRTNEPEREKVYRVRASSVPLSEARVLEDELMLARSSDGIENLEDELVRVVCWVLPVCEPPSPPPPPPPSAPWLVPG